MCEYSVLNPALMVIGMQDLVLQDIWKWLQLVVLDERYEPSSFRFRYRYFYFKHADTRYVFTYEACLIKIDKSDIVFLHQRDPLVYFPYYEKIMKIPRKMSHIKEFCASFDPSYLVGFYDDGVIDYQEEKRTISIYTGKFKDITFYIGCIFDGQYCCLDEIFNSADKVCEYIYAICAR